MEKEEILAEIRRTTEENGGKPLGRNRFEKVTGITSWELGKHWARFTDAQREAGFEPNKFDMAGFSEDFLMESLVSLVRELNQFPTRGEMRLRRAKDPTFPNDSVFYNRYGSKNELIGKVIEYSKNRSANKDILELLEPLYEANAISNTRAVGKNSEESKSGFVYLVKGHPGEYKIGRTNLVDRRLSELGATSSIEQTLVHEIKTDDPAGIEAYWHRRFQDKRMKGEWFLLNANDVKAFKRWRRIY